MRMVEIIAMALVVSLPLNAGWLERKAEGWAWYEEQENEEMESDQRQVVISAAESLAQARKQLDDLLAEAILNPSEENVLTYIQAQQSRLDQSARFSQIWVRSLLNHPELDPTASSFATSQYGRRLQKEIDQERRESIIQHISQSYGLFFFYEGGQKTSQAFAKVVGALGDKYNWVVIGISCDGQYLDGPLHNRADSGLREELGVMVLPALIGVNPKTKNMVPLAFGLQSMDQIESNIEMQFQHLIEEIQ